MSLFVRNDVSISISADRNGLLFFYLSNSSRALEDWHVISLMPVTWFKPTDTLSSLFAFYWHLSAFILLFVKATGSMIGTWSSHYKKGGENNSREKKRKCSRFGECISGPWLKRGKKTLRADGKQMNGSKPIVMVDLVVKRAQESDRLLQDWNDHIVGNVYNNAWLLIKKKELLGTGWMPRQQGRHFERNPFQIWWYPANLSVMATCVNGNAHHLISTRIVIFLCVVDPDPVSRRLI